MKSILLFFLLLTLVACNGGGSSGEEAEATNSNENNNSVSYPLPSISFEGSNEAELKVGDFVNLVPSILDSNGSEVLSCITIPSLPLGLTIENSTCVISGTPTLVMPLTNYNVVVTNLGGQSTAQIAIAISSVPSISYGETTGTQGIIGIGMSISPSTLSSNGSPISNCTISPNLAPGLTLNSSTCVISGIPTEVIPPTNYTITATNGVGSVTSNVTLSVVSTPSLSFVDAQGTIGTLNSAFSVVPTIFSNNGSPIILCSIYPALVSGLTIDASTCEITGVPSASFDSTLYTVTATNGVGSTTADLILSVIPKPAISYSGTTGTTGIMGQYMSVIPTTLASNGSSITSCTISPSLGSGLSINNSTCVISGTPSSVLPSTTYSITATNDSGSTSTSVILKVISIPSISYVGATGTTGSIGVSMMVVPTSLNDNGSPITNCTISPALGAGLSINSSTCIISGTPSVISSLTTYTVTATNGAGSKTATVSLRVLASAPSISYSGSTGTTGSTGTLMSVSPTTLNNNGSSITNCTISPSLVAGLSINTSTCVISGTPSAFLASTTYTVTATNSIGSTSAQVSLNINSAPSINFAGVTGATGSVGVIFSVSPTTLNNNGSAITNCTISPSLSNGLSINSSTCVISGTPTAVLSSTSYTITASNSIGSASSSVTLSIQASAPSISYLGATGTSGVYGTSMLVSPTTLNNNGAAISNCTISPSLSAGLSINPSTCVISGTPTTTISSTSYTVTVTNTAGSTNTNLTLNVQASVPTISFDNPNYRSVTVGSTLLQQLPFGPSTLNTNGGPITNCTTTPALPTGITINPSTCAISGIPIDSLPITTFTITATNSAGSSSATARLQINATAPTISFLSATNTTWSVGSPNSLSPSVLLNNGAPITNCTVTPSLPAGLSINPLTCVISGTRSSTFSSTTFSVTAINGSMNMPASGSSTASVTLKASQPPTIDFSPSSIGYIGIPFSISPRTLNGNGESITNCTTSPALPSSLSINPTTCEISGTPTTEMVSTYFTITATSAGGSGSSPNIILTIRRCPEDYVPVPANAEMGLNSFCVAKYEMKNVFGEASSRATLTPWVSISQVDAKNACTNLNALKGFTNRYDLISNREWIAIAHEIEKTASNWSGGIVGTGQINRGHSDNLPNHSLSVGTVSIPTSDPYYGTDNNPGQAVGSGWEQKRTHTLSNNEIIWDLSGNVAEWVDWTTAGALSQGPQGCGVPWWSAEGSWQEIPNVSCNELSALDYMPKNPSNKSSSTYNSTFGLGKVSFFWEEPWNNGAVTRGWPWGVNSGIFNIHLGSHSTNTNSQVGFRCVFRP